VYELAHCEAAKQTAQLLAVQVQHLQACSPTLQQAWIGVLLAPRSILSRAWRAVASSETPSGVIGNWLLPIKTSRAICEELPLTTLRAHPATLREIAMDGLETAVPRSVRIEFRLGAGEQDPAGRRERHAALAEDPHRLFIRTVVFAEDQHCAARRILFCHSTPPTEGAISTLLKNPPHWQENHARTPPGLHFFRKCGIIEVRLEKSPHANGELLSKVRKPPQNSIDSILAVLATDWKRISSPFAWGYILRR
jgi:hypothetical protein